MGRIPPTYATNLGYWGSGGRKTAPSSVSQGNAICWLAGFRSLCMVGLPLTCIAISHQPISPHSEMQEGHAPARGPRPLSRVILMQRRRSSDATQTCRQRRARQSTRLPSSPPQQQKNIISFPMYRFLKPYQLHDSRLSGSHRCTRTSAWM